MAVLNNQAMTGEHHTLSDEELLKDDITTSGSKDGCLVLGKLPHTDAFVYYTKYRINHKLRRKGTCTEALEKTFVPCLDKDNVQTCVDFLSTFLKSEFFLLILHLGALLLCASKEALDLRSLNPKLHFVTTVFEKVICVVTILLRVFGTYINFKELNELVSKWECTEDKRTAYSKSLRVSCIIFTLLATLVILLVVAGFVLLHLYSHLGWTIVTTNSSLLIMQVLYMILKDRQGLLMDRITIDHHKIALEESLLLIKEGMCYRGWVNKEYINRCRSFIIALDNTPLFMKPYYIEIDDSDNLTMCETITSV